MEPSYTRKTDYMEATADVLASDLPAGFRTVHGLHVTYQGRPIHLEHVIAGSKGVDLLESVTKAMSVRRPQPVSGVPARTSCWPSSC